MSWSSGKRGESGTGLHPRAMHLYMKKPRIPTIFCLLFIVGYFWLSAPLVAQIRLETVTVMPDEPEAVAELGYPAPLMLSWTFENPPPPGARIEFQRGIPGELGMPAIITLPVADLTGNKWGDMGAMPTLRSERYALVLLDADGETIGIMSRIHGTIFLRPWDTSADLDPCNRSLTLRWNDYVYNDPVGTETPLPPFFNYNQLMVVRPGETAEEVAATMNFGDESLEGREVTYLFDGGPGAYYFRIRAVENQDGTGRVSYSNRRGITYTAPAIDDPELVSVDVADNQYMELSVDLAGSVDDFEFRVLRSAEPDQGFEPAGVLNAPAPGLNAFTDMDVPDLAAGKWYYRIQAYIRDAGCEDPAHESGTQSSLFLAGEVLQQTGDILEVGLSWDQDPAWDGFILQRMLPEENDWQDVGAFPAAPSATTDDLSPMLDGLAGEVRYRMLAQKGGQTVRSNEYLVVVEPRVEIPNVFSPTAAMAENRYFRPDFMGLTPTSMQLKVFNRWGQEIYAVTDPESGWTGWDGKTANGGDAPPGMYAYTLEYQFPGSQKSEVSGTLMLIR